MMMMTWRTSKTWRGAATIAEDVAETVAEAMDRRCSPNNVGATADTMRVVREAAVVVATRTDVVVAMMLIRGLERRHRRHDMTGKISSQRRRY